MDNKRLILYIALILVFFVCFTNKETFANTNNDKKFKVVKLNNLNYRIISFSQLKNDIKKKLVSNNLDLFNKLLGSDFSTVLKFIERNKEYVPTNDPLILIDKNFDKILTDKHTGIVFDQNTKPFYRTLNVYENNKQQVNILENHIVLSTDTKIKPSSINFSNNKIDNEFFNTMSISIDGHNLLFLKKGSNNEKIIFS